MPTLVGTPVNAVDYSGSLISTLSAPAFKNTAGNLLVAQCRYSATGSSSPPTLSDTAGNTWLKAVGLDSAGDGNTGLSIFYAFQALANASNVVTAAFSPTQKNCAITISEYSGADATAQVLDAIATGNGTVAGATATSGNFTTIDKNEVICACATWAGDSTVTAGAGYTMEKTDAKTGYEDKKVSSGQIGVTATMTSSLSTLKWLIVVATFRASVPKMGNLGCGA